MYPVKIRKKDLSSVPRIFPGMKKLILFAASAALFVSQIKAQPETKGYFYDPGATPRDHPLDFTRMQLFLTLEPEKGLVKGRVIHSFTPLRPKVDSFFLDGINMSYSAITLNGKAVSYHGDSAGIEIIPSEPLEENHTYGLEISYEATPRKGIYFIGWNDKNNLSRKQVWTQGEATDNRHWIPMYDEKNDKVLSELTIRFDSAYQVLSNGNLAAMNKNPDGTNTWHYVMSHPQADYLVMLGIGKYHIRETHSGSGVPMHLYYYPEWEDRVDPTYQYSEAMVDFFEKEIGLPYPWESYSQIPVQDYMFGAMENTTATIYGDFYQVDKRGILDRNYIAVNAHELAHQWFGDYVTARTDADIWLQESFATYYNQQFEREVFGPDYFNWARRGSENAALDESLKNQLAVANSQSGGVRIYGKGAFVLHMLKYVVGGREAYNKAIKYYLEKHPYQNVDTHDLLIAFEETTGMDLSWFWEEWLYRGGEPAYSVSYNETGNTAEWVIKQKQELTDLTGFRKGLYKMPVGLEIHYTDGTVSKKIQILEEQTEILHMEIPEGKKTGFVLFDPGNEILKSVNFQKSFSMLESQALNATDMLDRYDAVAAMRNTDLDKKRSVLLNAYKKEQFYAPKTEVIAQLANDNNPQSIALLKKAIRDRDVQVRKAVLKTLSPLSPLAPGDFESLLTDSSYDIMETALSRLCSLNPAKTKIYLNACRGVDGNLGKNVKIRWLETAFTTTGKKQYAGDLVNYTGNSFEFRTRVNAMAALKRCGYFSGDLIANAIDALLSPNDRLSNPARDLLKFFYGQDKYRNSISAYIASGHWEPWQKAILSANDF
jgi:aminopeptidase N